MSLVSNSQIWWWCDSTKSRRLVSGPLRTWYPSIAQRFKMIQKHVLLITSFIFCRSNQHADQMRPEIVTLEWIRWWDVNFPLRLYLFSLHICICVCPFLGNQIHIKYILFIEMFLKLYAQMKQTVFYNDISCNIQCHFNYDNISWCRSLQVSL